MPLALTPEAQTAFNCPFINHSCIHKIQSSEISTIPTAIILISTLNSQHLVRISQTSTSSSRKIFQVVRSFQMIVPIIHAGILFCWKSTARNEKKTNKQKSWRTRSFLSWVCDRAVPMNVPTSVQVPRQCCANIGGRDGASAVIHHGVLSMTMLCRCNKATWFFVFVVFLKETPVRSTSNSSGCVQNAISLCLTPY